MLITTCQELRNFEVLRLHFLSLIFHIWINVVMPTRDEIVKSEDLKNNSRQNDAREYKSYNLSNTFKIYFFFHGGI